MTDPGQGEQPPRSGVERGEGTRGGGGGRSDRLLLVVIVLLCLMIIALAVTLALWLLNPSIFGVTDEATGVGEETTTTDLAAAGDFEVVEVAIGEPAVAEPFVITVTGAGRPAEDVPFEAPAEGTYYFLVSVEFENTGETIPLNALPYGVDGTVLVSGDDRFEGIMQVDFSNPMQQGTIPGGSVFTVNFIFQVAESVSDLTFVWTPRTEGFPQIRVPL